MQLQLHNLRGASVCLTCLTSKIFSAGVANPTLPLSPYAILEPRINAVTAPAFDTKGPPEEPGVGSTSIDW